MAEHPINKIKLKAPPVSFEKFVKNPKPVMAAAKRKATFSMIAAGRKIMRPGGAGGGLIRNKLKGQF